MAARPAILDSSSPVRRSHLALLILAVGAGIYFFRHDVVAMLIVIGGGLVIAGVLYVYGLIVRAARRRRSASLERAIVSHGASYARSNDPGRRARVEDLRKQFENGIAKFRSAGKDLYSRPWFLIIGEPGSGKTECVRRSNVGFPPGLQDMTQGIGGTINMNWWFTQHGVILDTAGRLVFEEVTPGRSSEWDEFLKLLYKARKNAPINGIILVIPADSLITDTADVIERKARQIAQQFDHVQRTLGIRFPVFVIVTKCDLINGFREFFNGLTDPQLQHQMLGWSNPESLEAPFQPEQLEQHLQAVRTRLLRRRQTLLLDPVNTQDANASRMQEVDALYPFPDAFLRIAPRLQSYLETVFTAGQWTGQPPFLRGIYFTSSIRDGSALDEELAETLKLPVHRLKADPRTWERERAYFLKDVFVNKVFREKGLVIRFASSVAKWRAQKLMGLAIATVCISALLYFTWAGAAQLNHNLGKQARFWAAVDKSWSDHRDDWRLVAPDQANPGAYRYNGGQVIDLGDIKQPLATVLADAGDRARRNLDVPWVFRAQQMMRGDTDDHRRAASRALLESSLVLPVLQATREKLHHAATDSAPPAPDAIAELVRLEVTQAVGRHANEDAATAAAFGPIRMYPLMRAALPDADYQKFREDGQILQSAIDSAYTPVSKDDPASGGWPPASIATTSDSAQTAIDAGVDAIFGYYITRLQGANTRITSLKSVQDAVDVFQRAEDRFFQVARNVNPAAPVDNFARNQPDWLGELRSIQLARESVDAALGKLGDINVNKPLLGRYESEVDREIDAAKNAYQLIGKQIPKSLPEDAPATRHLESLRKSLTEAPERFAALRALTIPEDVKSDLARCDANYLTPARGLDGKDHPKYIVLAQIYDRVRDKLDAVDLAARNTNTADTAAKIDEETAASKRDLAALATVTGPGSERIQQAVKTGTALIEWAANVRKARLTRPNNTH